MARSRKGWLATLLLALGASTAAKTLPEPIDVPVDVAVDADGRVVSAEIATRLPRATAERVLARARGFRFTPARKGGRAVPARTTVWLALAFEPLDDERVAVRIRDAYTGARWVRSVPPRYPAAAVRQRLAADETLRLAYDARGRVPSAEVERSGGRAFDEAAAAAARRWRLRPEEVDGVPQPGTLLAPISFRIFGAGEVPPSTLPAARGTPSDPPSPFAEGPARALQCESIVTLLDELSGTLL